MDARTGQIFLDVNDETAKAKGLVPIPSEDAERVINMNRRQRRAWAAQQRKEGKKTSP